MILPIWPKCPFLICVKKAKLYWLQWDKCLALHFQHTEFSKLARNGAKPELQPQTPKLGGSLGWNTSFAAGLSTVRRKPKPRTTSPVNPEENCVWIQIQTLQRGAHLLMVQMKARNGCLLQRKLPAAACSEQHSCLCTRAPARQGWAHKSWKWCASFVEQQQKVILWVLQNSL